jgi:hypothetical protein
MRIPVKWPAGGVAAKFIRQAGWSKLGFPAPNRPETHVVVAEYQDVRLGGSGGTNPARRFWTRLPAALRPVHAQVLQPPLKLVEFQPHTLRPLDNSNLHQIASGIARSEAVVSP